MRESRSEKTLRLVSINTWKCDGDYSKRLEILCSQLKQLKPDIICCQEAFQSHDYKYDTIKELAVTLNMCHCFIPLRKKTRQFQGNPILCASGLGVVSSCDILSNDVVMLPDHPEDRDRAAQVVCVRKWGKTILIVNTHLTHLKDQTELRIAQINKLLAATPLQKKYDLTVVCGDFNAEPESPEILRATTHPQKPLFDVLARFSASRNIDTYPAHHLGKKSPISVKRLDYIFMTTRLSRNHEQSIQAGLALTHPSKEGVFASDHFGVYVDFPL